MEGRKAEDGRQRTDDRRWTTDGRRKKKKGTKKDKKSRKHGFLREILKIGVVGGRKRSGFIGLICFWLKNEGKNEQKLIRN